MTRRLRLPVASIMGFVMAVGFVLAAGIEAQARDKTLEQMIKLRQQGIYESAQSQGRIDSMDDETSALTAEYKATLKKLDALKVYNGQLQALIDAQEKEMASINDQIAEITDIDRKIVPLMLDMIEGLDLFVQADVPFLAEERNGRVAALRALMQRADATPAEKFRRILEAYQIENEYGRTIEAYQGNLSLGGTDRTVDYLRFGRIAFIYRSLDGEDIGVWNQKAGQWEELDSDYASSVQQGLRIARKQAAPDLMILPVQAPETAQ